jgi:signal transduction histidine kinase
MTSHSVSNRQRMTAALADARQALNLMRSQLEAKQIEPAYWKKRLAALDELLTVASNELASSDEQSRLAALYNVSRLIGSSLDLEEVLNQSMDAIIQLTGAERGFLMLIDQEGELDVKAARNLERETLNEDEFAISRTIIRSVAESGEPVVTTNAAQDPRFSEQSSVVRYSLRSIQCAPLRARGKVIGVIYVDNRARSGLFTQADLDMLSAFASQAAVAIENARLFQQTDQALAARVEELQVMQEVDRQLSATLDFHKVMELTLHWALRVTHADGGSIYMVDRESGQPSLVAAHPEQAGAEEGEAQDRGLVVARRLLESGELSVMNVEEDGAVVTQMGVPVQCEGQTIGIIALMRAGAGSLGEEAQKFVTRLASHAAIAISNAQLYEAVREANRAKSEFVSVVTHELRIPMTSIKGYTDLIGMVGSLNEQQTGFVDTIRNNVARMTTLVNDLSDVSRIETGRLSLEVEDVNFREVVEQALEATRTQIEERKHSLQVELSDDLPVVRGDPKRLVQILVNLISNAYKYTPEGGSISIRARREGSSVRCEVEDTGIGMTPEEVDKLFTKFWRAADDHVRDQPGTGLGLNIAKNLVELHGGQIEVKSQKDTGSTFAFSMPVVE